MSDRFTKTPTPQARSPLNARRPSASRNSLRYRTARPVLDPPSSGKRSKLSKRGSRKSSASSPPNLGGARRDRTDDLMLAKHALSQLSYGPERGVGNRQSARRVRVGQGPRRETIPADCRLPIPYCLTNLVGLGGLEPPTSRLSSARSNQLSYKPLSEDRGRSSAAQVQKARSRRSPSSDIWEEREAKAAASRKCGL